jgi:hypothetical protein
MSKKKLKALKATVAAEQASERRNANGHVSDWIHAVPPCEGDSSVCRLNCDIELDLKDAVMLAAEASEAKMTVDEKIAHIIEQYIVM